MDYLFIVVASAVVTRSGHLSEMTELTLLGPQSRFGNKPLTVEFVWFVPKTGLGS